MRNSTTLMHCKRILQGASYQRLAIALALSFLLHLFFIGKFYFNLPDLNESSHLIEAQLVLRKSAPPQIPLSKPILAPVKTEPIVKNIATVKQKPPEPEAPGFTTPAGLPSPQTTEATENITQIKPSDTESAVESVPEEPSVGINPQAYKYVETTFDVRTDIAASANSSAPGKAKIVYELLSNGEQYKIKSLVEAKGLAALVIPDLLQTSDGYLINTGLQPRHYLYQFGDSKNKTFSADFDWGQKKLYLHAVKGDQALDLVDGTQDLLSFMYQFMFSPPLQTLQFNVTNGKRLGVYEYNFEGEETITTKMGNLTTFHILKVSNDSEEKTELWLALDYQYVPVKIRKTEKDGKVYELLATSLKTEKPVTQSQ
jgi:hypothetical protein